MYHYSFFNRDISWLSFNERVLMEAASHTVPLMERLKFLSIFSSNLDEFFRVRIPAIQSLQKFKEKDEKGKLLTTINEIVYRQQEKFGSLLEEQIIPALKDNGVYIVYNEPIPASILREAIDYFFTNISSFVKVARLDRAESFFPENNKLYVAISLQGYEKKEMAFVNIPSDECGRFFVTRKNDLTYVVFIDDIIEHSLDFIFPHTAITGSYRIKITRDAELELMDEVDGDISEKIEQQIKKRDYGKATRFLHSPDLPEKTANALVRKFNLRQANIIQGGNYHNLKDFISLPLLRPDLHYPPQLFLEYSFRQQENSLLREIDFNDVVIHTPFYSYNTVLRFFNEAAISDDVEEIYTTLYRVASDSKIVNALISAAYNGKKVTVFVELKARFDEANNIKWGKRMKASGIKVIYSIPGLKVHAKIALIKRRGTPASYSGLLATGNLNETTARFYTDHILLTSNTDILFELEKLFQFLSRQKKSSIDSEIDFNHLLVSQFNLQQKFIDLIDAEIQNAKKGLPASITIKLNNLEEKILIQKLYDASNAGVEINLIVRSICCLVPGVPHMSENIVVKRIVDRYLEHGRIFIFNNNNNSLVFMGSSDWMNRNIYRRIEVCFPVYDRSLKNQIQSLVAIQLQDDVKAVQLTSNIENNYSSKQNGNVRSQEEIFHYCRSKANHGLIP